MIIVWTLALLYKCWHTDPPSLGWLFERYLLYHLLVNTSLIFSILKKNWMTLYNISGRYKTQLLSAISQATKSTSGCVRGEKDRAMLPLNIHSNTKHIINWSKTQTTKVLGNLVKTWQRAKLIINQDPNIHSNEHWGKEANWWKHSGRQGGAFRGNRQGRKKQKSKQHRK